VQQVLADMEAAGIAVDLQQLTSCKANSAIRSATPPKPRTR